MSDLVCLSWDQVDKLVSKLALQVKKIDDPKLIGIPRGGVLVANLLAHKLNTKQVVSSMDSWKHWAHKNIVLVDDICDSGDTFTAEIKLFNEHTNHWWFKNTPVLTTASLVTRITSHFKPNFSGLIYPKTDWIVFPWEDSDEEERRHIQWQNDRLLSPDTSSSMQDTESSSMNQSANTSTGTDTKSMSLLTQQSSTGSGGLETSET